MISRNVTNTYWFSLENVVVKTQKPSKAKSKSKVSTKSAETSVQKFRSCRVKKLKMLCHKPIIGNKLKVIKTDNPSPYVIEVEEVIRRKKEKGKLLSVKELEKKNQNLYDPRAHVIGVSGGKASSAQDFLRPAPYNEKLRRGGRENSRAIAETQVTAWEVLKGQYRKGPREYPHRCVELTSTRNKIDNQYVAGRRVASRLYTIALTREDRALAEMAETAGMCLNLTGHNIHVVTESRSRKGQYKEQYREQYSTRRKHQLEKVSYDASKGYVKIKRPTRVKPEPTSESSSDASPSPPRKSKSSKDGTHQKEMELPVEPSYVKLEAPEPDQDEELQEIPSVLDLLKVEPNIEVDENKEVELAYQDELEEFFMKQYNPDQVLDPEEVDRVLDGLVEEEEVPEDQAVEIDLDLIG